MRLFLFTLLTLFPLGAQSAWVVKSEFQLHLSEGLFDEVIADFWQSLQGKQNIPIDNFVITPGGIPIRIEGVKAEVNYSFPLPSRIDDRTREWELHSDALSARLTVDKISATQTIIREENGIIIKIPLQADCYNVVLKLPAGSTRVSARVRAEVMENQVKLTLPHYEAEWREGAWEVENLHCTGLEGLDVVVKEEALKALSSFQNFDAEVRAALTENFQKWSKDASLLLLSERELPSGKDYLKIYYEPHSAEEAGTGLLLSGLLRFEYPYVAQGQHIEHSYQLATTRNKAGKVPQLLLPFATIRMLMMGEYFAGRLEYSMRSYELPAFQEFMQSRWQQFWAFPELMRYAKNTTFAFQFLPMGPPSFEKEAAGSGNTIQGEMNLPLSVRMFAPLGGKYRPMVEFRTLLSGPTTLKLLDNGKIAMQIQAQKYPVRVGWSQSYVRNYNPSTRIAVETISDKVRGSLNAEGFTMEMPSLTVGKALKLVPQKWNLEGANLRMDFTTKK